MRRIFPRTLSLSTYQTFLSRRACAPKMRLCYKAQSLTWFIYHLQSLPKKYDSDIVVAQTLWYAAHRNKKNKCFADEEYATLDCRMIVSSTARFASWQDSCLYSLLFRPLTLNYLFVFNACSTERLLTSRRFHLLVSWYNAKSKIILD